MKICKECLIQKEECKFDLLSSGNRRKICRKCRNDKGRTKYFSNPENVIKDKERRLKYNKDKYDKDPYRKIYLQCLYRVNYKIKNIDNNLELKNHFESLFTTGMNWDNYGTYWEVDHKISALKMIRSGYTIEEVNKLNNIRPMIISENRTREKEYYKKSTIQKLKEYQKKYYKIKKERKQ